MAVDIDLGSIASILAIGAFCFGIWRFFLSHAEKYDESHAKNREEHELIIETLVKHTQTNEKLNKSVKKLIKQSEK